MSDVKCPKCGIYQEINHDDGYGYQEDENYEQSCTSCDYEFKFLTSISYNYEVLCQDTDHKMEQALDDHPDFFMCKNCDHSELRRD